MTNKTSPARCLFREHFDQAASLAVSVESLDLDKFREKYNFDLLKMQPSFSESNLNSSKSQARKNYWSWQCLDTHSNAYVPEFYRTSKMDTKSHRKPRKPRDLSCDSSSTGCSSIENHVPDDDKLDMTLIAQSPKKLPPTPINIAKFWNARIRRSSCSAKELAKFNKTRNHSTDSPRNGVPAKVQKEPQVTRTETPFNSPQKSQVRKSFTQRTIEQCFPKKPPVPVCLR
ncbi:hypothetical protein Ciccas_005810 [Cichlidogyrus casuarinus]|uniref:Uncharacterized protein n=1 Tax=Cichlidogyrus casuarinus TaxID=1844966 RepID=A0ABD2QBA4_9PLAT